MWLQGMLLVPEALHEEGLIHQAMLRRGNFHIDSVENPVPLNLYPYGKDGFGARGVVLSDSQVNQAPPNQSTALTQPHTHQFVWLLACSELIACTRRARCGSQRGHGPCRFRLWCHSHERAVWLLPRAQSELKHAESELKHAEFELKHAEFELKHARKGA